MPKRKDLKKIMIIGSGPIVIGQAAEFDYAGTQACLALKEEGYEVVLVNSNPATIMTDTSIADKVYMEPLTLEYVARILRLERPDAIIPGLGGQTGLNLAMELEENGVLRECQVELLGTPGASIRMAEDREEFKELCQRIGEPVIPSIITYSIEDVDTLGHAVWNNTYSDDEELYKLAVSMRQTEPGDIYGYVSKWMDFQDRYNEVLPTIPIYSNIYFDFYNEYLQNYEITAQVTWTQAILLAYFGLAEEAPAEDAEAADGEEFFE